MIWAGRRSLVTSRLKKKKRNVTRWLSISRRSASIQCVDHDPFPLMIDVCVQSTAHTGLTLILKFPTPSHSSIKEAGRHLRATILLLFPTHMLTPILPLTPIQPLTLIQLPTGQLTTLAIYSQDMAQIWDSMFMLKVQSLRTNTNRTWSHILILGTSGLQPLITLTSLNMTYPTCHTLPRHNKITWKLAHQSHSIPLQLMQWERTQHIILLQPTIQLLMTLMANINRIATTTTETVGNKLMLLVKPRMDLSLSIFLIWVGFLTEAVRKNFRLMARYAGRHSAQLAPVNVETASVLEMDSAMTIL